MSTKLDPVSIPNQNEKSGVPSSHDMVAHRGVVEDLSGLRVEGTRLKTRSRPLTFTKAVANFRTLHVVGNEF
jgi:hypothetical protein